LKKQVFLRGRTILMKDNFSKQSDQYARFRPLYPADLFDFLLQLLVEKQMAWDCGTGNGQVALALAPYFHQVLATDISAAQLEKAPSAENIRYAVAPAEACPAPEACCNLVVAGQAAHWFHLDEFYREVRRVSLPGGILALFGYGLLQTDAPVQALLEDFYTRETGPFWDAERRHVDARYQSFPFPFEEIEAPPLWMEYAWTPAHFLGYLSTWSAVQHYIRKKGQDPVAAYAGRFLAIWPENDIKMVRFPLFMRVGRV
jgi:SAM-dependent methyltransferase